MKVAFTGTRQGMTLEQKTSFLFLVLEKQPDEFHHGDCIGADQEAHTIMRGDEMLGLQRVCKVVIHPPDNSQYRAYRHGDIVLPERPYLARNQDIVVDCDILIACPKEVEEVRRSGTWATIRYAKKQQRPVFLITPDGVVKENL